MCKIQFFKLGYCSILEYIKSMWVLYFFNFILEQILFFILRYKYYYERKFIYLFIRIYNYY